MITDAIIAWFMTLVRDCIQLLPDWEMPAWLDQLADPIASVMGVGASLGAWVPTGLAVTVVSAVVVCWTVSFAVKAIRIVASFFTAGGGSAA